MDKYFKVSASYATNEARVIRFMTKYKHSNNVEAVSLLASHIKCWVNVFDAVKYSVLKTSTTNKYVVPSFNSSYMKSKPAVAYVLALCAFRKHQLVMILLLCQRSYVTFNPRPEPSEPPERWASEPPSNWWGGGQNDPPLTRKLRGLERRKRGNRKLSTRLFEVISIIFSLKSIFRSLEVIKGHILQNDCFFSGKPAIISGTITARKKPKKHAIALWTFFLQYDLRFELEKIVFAPGVIKCQNNCFLRNRFRVYLFNQKW